MSRSHRRAFAGLLAAALTLPLAGQAQKGAPATGEWRAYAGDAGSTRYSPLDQINRDNVKNLQVAWTLEVRQLRRPGSPARRRRSWSNGVLYFTVGPRRNVVAVNPGTGETLWTWRPDEGERVRPGAAQGAPRRRLLDRRHGRHASSPSRRASSWSRSTRRPACRFASSARTASSISSRSSITT